MPWFYGLPASSSIRGRERRQGIDLLELALPQEETHQVLLDQQRVAMREAEDATACFPALPIQHLGLIELA
jgi:hypothetical protein